MSANKIKLLVIRPPIDSSGDWGPLPEKYLQQLMVVSPQLEVQDASALADEAKRDLTEAKNLYALLADTEIIWMNRPINDLIASAPGLKWIHSPLSGVDAFAIPEIIESPVILTNSSGIHGTQVGETAIAHMILLAKRAPYIFRQMGEKRFEAFVPVVLESKTVGILGLGPIGNNIARLCKGFRMRVLGVEANPKVKCRYTDAIFPSQKLHEVLSQCDFIVNALPMLASTKNIIGEPELQAMKPTSFFINIGRGGTVDQDALIRALSDNRIAGAGIDAFTPEPLPPSSKLWELPNVIITPHIAGKHEDYTRLATDLFCKNLERYLSGKQLFNIIDKKTLGEQMNT
ncbi:D-2-hydroxyacid dehydrogenase [Chloroflexota bacterium]